MKLKKKLLSWGNFKDNEMTTDCSIKQTTYIFINPEGTLVARSMSQYAY